MGLSRQRPSSLVPGCCLGVLVVFAVVLVLTGPARVSKPPGHAVAVLEHGFVDHAASVPGAPVRSDVEPPLRRTPAVPLRGEPRARAAGRQAGMDLPFLEDPGAAPTGSGVPADLPAGFSSDGARAAEGEGADDAGLFDMSMP